MKKYIHLLMAGIIFFASEHSFGDIPKETKNLMDMVLENPARLNEYENPEEKITNFMLLVSSISVPDAIETAINNGAKVEARDTSGNTPLNYLAALNTDAVGALDVLLKNTKDINNKGSDGKTPFMMAIEHGQGKEFLDHMIKAGVDLNMVSNENSAISLAAKNGRSDTIAFLVSQKGIKIEPEVLNYLAHIDELDTQIEEYFPDFDFKGVTHTYKHQLIKAVQQDWIEMPWITYRKKDTPFPANAFKINGLSISDYLSQKATKKDFDTRMFRQADIWRLFKSSAFFLADGTNFPDLKQQYIGEYQDKKGTRQAYDVHCKYDMRNRNIVRNCKKVPEKYSYTEFGNGVIRYTYKGSDIALLVVKKGEIITKLGDIPYFKILDEIVKKYGDPARIKYDNNAHYFYFSNDASTHKWNPVVVVFIDKKIAQDNDFPSGIMTFYVNKNADTVMKNALKEQKNKFKRSFKEEKAYWNKIKKKHDQRLNSFSL